MLNTKIKDMLSSAIESGIETSATVISEVFIDSAIGSILPGITTAALSYKQKKMERNILEFMNQLLYRIDLLEKWRSLKENRKDIIKEKFAGIILDYVIDEKELNKIHFMANGFTNLVLLDSEMKEDRIIEYYDILERLRVIDLQVLIDYDSKVVHTTENYLELRNLNNGEFNYTKIKLFNLGLLKSDRDAKYQKFFNDVIDTFEGKRSVPSINRRVPNLRVPYGNNYSLSSLGKTIVDFFCFISK